MNWRNLQLNKCPQCNKDTALAHPYDYIATQDLFVHKCGFRITQAKYKEIVAQRITRELEDSLNRERDLEMAQ